MDNYQITSYSGAEIEALLVKIDELNGATPEAAGLMSAADKAKLDGVNSGAEVNRINRIMLGETEIAPTEKVVTLPLDSAPVLNGTKLLLSGAVYHALTNYYTKAQVDALISGIKQFSAVVVATLPESGEQFTLYLVGPTGTGADKYEEYIWNNDAWLKIGDTSIDLSGYATKEELSQLGQKVDEFQYLQDASVLDFRPGYISGSTGNHYVTVEDNTRHYAIIPTRPNLPLQGIIPFNCVCYQKVDLDENFNVLSFSAVTDVTSPNAKYIALNFNDADNSYNDVVVLQGISLSEQDRFLSHDYNCFCRSGEFKDVEQFGTNGGNIILFSRYLRSIISLKLIGFNKDNPHYLRTFTRNYGTQHRYRIIIWEKNNGTWASTFDASLYDVETNGYPNGVNSVTWTSGTKTVKAVVDYSFVPEGIVFNMGVTAFHIKKECFEDFDALDTQLQTLQSNAILKSMLGYSVVSDNLANPEDIQTDRYIRSDGVVASQTGWAVGSAPVVAGQKVTFGGFKLGRSGYYRFQDANGNRVSYGNYTDPNFRANPITLDVPATAVLLFIDIASTSSPDDPYSGLQVNMGDTLLPYDEYKDAITSINNEPLAGGASKELENRVEDLEDSVATLQEEIGVGLSNVIADLPVSDGTGIEVGYAYIDSSTSVVKVKLS